MKKKKRQKKDRTVLGLCVMLVLLLGTAAVFGVWLKTSPDSPLRSASDDQSKENSDAGREQAEGKENEDSQDTGKSSDDGEKSQEELREEKVSELLEDMTLEEKVCQLFMITPEALTGMGVVTQAGELTQQSLNEYPVGGLIYFSQNLIDPEQTRDMLAMTKQYAMERSGIPILLSVDEEGGQVARVSSNPAFGITPIGNMSDVGARGDVQEAYQIGAQIGSYLSDLGFNMDAAPDADVLTNPWNEVVAYRSFGSDPQLVASMAEAELQGLEDQGILGLYKHYPGHGGTAADSHEGQVYVEETLDELMDGAFVPFQQGIDAGTDVIMVSHISCPNVTGDYTPATLSYLLVTEILREDMGFDGIVITDALNMGAITQLYTSDQAAVAALQAGADILLMPEDFQTAYNGVLQAVASGTLTEERIDQSVRRILNIKIERQEDMT